MKNKLDEHLKQLSKEAQQSSPKSRERQIALNKLLNLIIKSGKIIYPYRNQSKGLYEEIYAEALQNLFVFICTRIEDYNPERGDFLTWVNFLFQRRFFPEAASYYMQITSTNKLNRRCLSLDIEDYELIPSNYQSSNSLYDELMDYLKEDYEYIFRNTYLAKRPSVNFQKLAIKRLSGASWQEIAEEYKVPVPTLSSFYQRCLTKFAPKFKEYFSVD